MPVFEGGLELANFSVSANAPSIPKPVLRGGPWRERRRLKLKQQQFESPNEPRPEAEEYRPAKRFRTEPNSSVTSFKERPREERPRDEGPDRQVISSLFKFNPAATTHFPSGAGENVAAQPSNAPLTEEQLKFTELGLDTRIATHLIEKLSITAPTAIQKAAIPLLVKNKADAFIQAETGSGKTFAYLLPLIQQLVSLSAQQKIHRDSGLFAIILVPTRELTKQISAVLESLLRCANWLVCGTVIGGESKKSEKARIRKGINILVATPGRLADHLTHTQSLDPSSVRWLILDEGDRMMELGFEEDIEKILKVLDMRLEVPKKQIMEILPKKRTNILCSATMKANVEKLGELSLKDAEHITADSDVEPGDAVDSAIRFRVPAQLKQSFIVTPAKLRLVTLVGFLKNTFARCQPTAKAIVFMSCADSVDFHFKVFSRSESTEKQEDAKLVTPKKPHVPRKGTQQRISVKKANLDQSATSGPSPIISSESRKVTVFRLHGSLTQETRSNALKTFSKYENPAVLFCTDIAARGLDLPHLDRVIEFDPAFSREEHLHRVGRTARAGKDGAATVYLMPGSEEGYTQVLNEDRGIPGSISGQAADHILRLAFSPGSVPSKKSAWEDAATELQLDIERWVLADESILESARKAFKSHIRAYATHVKDERQYFDIQELHLGHLAKAFGLRDRPGNVNVPGMRTGSGKRDKRSLPARKTIIKSLDIEIDNVDMGSARKKIEAKAKSMFNSIDEFNLA